MVPEGWKAEKLKNLLNGGVKNGYSPIASEQETGYWVLGLGALRDDGINPIEIKPVEPTDKVRGALLSSGDFLVSRSNTPDKVGRSIMYKGEVPQCSYPDLMMRFRVDPRYANPEFIEHNLKSSSVRRYFKNSAAGSSGSMVKINKGILENTPISLPPLPEQKKIAQILSTWDQAITATERLLENSQQRKKGLMQQLLTGKKRLPGFEGEWEDGHLKDIAAISKGKALSSKDLEDGVFPVVAGGKTSPYTHKTYTHDHAITVSASGAYAGYVAYHEYKFWASDCSVVEASEESNIEFLYHLMTWNQQRIYALQSGGAQPHVYPKDLHAIRVLIPSKKEQQAIANILTTASKETEQLQNRVNRLKQEKKALMQQLLTGKRRVNVDMEAA